MEIATCKEIIRNRAATVALRTAPPAAPGSPAANPLPDASAPEKRGGAGRTGQRGKAPQRAPSLQLRPDLLPWPTPCALDATRPRSSSCRRPRSHPSHCRRRTIPAAAAHPQQHHWWNRPRVPDLAGEPHRSLARRHRTSIPTARAHHSTTSSRLRYATGWKLNGWGRQARSISCTTCAGRYEALLHHRATVEPPSNNFSPHPGRPRPEIHAGDRCRSTAPCLRPATPPQPPFTTRHSLTGPWRARSPLLHARPWARTGAALIRHPVPRYPSFVGQGPVIFARWHGQW